MEELNAQFALFVHQETRTLRDSIDPQHRTRQGVRTWFPSGFMTRRHFDGWDERADLLLHVVIFRSDQEHELITPINEAAIRVKQKGVNVLTEESARYDSRENGLAEGGAKDVKDQTRSQTLHRWFQ